MDFFKAHSDTYKSILNFKTIKNYCASKITDSTSVTSYNRVLDHNVTSHGTLLMSACPSNYSLQAVNTQLVLC